MFVRADRLLRGEVVSWHSLHALWYHWDGFRPLMDVYESESEELRELDLAEELSGFGLSVAEERLCVGRFQDGAYQVCPDHARLEGDFDQCRSCAGTWIPVQECIFEPQCAGDRCDSPLCRREHVVYATFFGDMVKIGMTAGSRLAQRSIEQGADAVARLARFPNRLEARRAEKDISRMLRLPQRVRSEQMAEEVLKNPRPYRLRARHEDILSRLEGCYPLLHDRLEMLDRYPGLEELRESRQTPRRVDAVGPHDGRMVSIKGRYLFYEDEGEVLMLPLSDITSRHLELGHNK